MRNLKYLFYLLVTGFCFLPLTTNAQQYIDDYLTFERLWSPFYMKGNIVGGWAMDAEGIYWADGGTHNTFNWSAVTNKELFEIRDSCSDGQSYLFLNGYKPFNTTLPSNVVYWIKSTKILITTGNNLFDISHIANTNGGCSKLISNLNGSNGSHYVGMPYAPYIFWDQNYRIQVWGQICDANGVCNQRQFYWDALWLPYQLGRNYCWDGAGSSLRNTLNLTEAYWDSYSGWSHGNGSIDPQTNLPSGNNITYQRTVGYGEGVGPNWTYKDHETGKSMCTRFSYPW